MNAKYLPTLKPWVLLISSILVFFNCSSSKPDRWQLVHQAGSVEAAGVGPIEFNQNGEGWGLTWANLYKLSENGRLWNSVLSNESSEKAFYSFAFTTPTVGFVVGAQKKGDTYSVLILQTSDGGVSWQERATNARTESDRKSAPQLNSVVFCGKDTGWAAGEDVMLHTIDSGETWQTQQVNVQGGGRLFSIACTNSQRAWAVGKGGLLLRTINGGRTWVRQDLGTEETLMRVRFFGESGWIVGGRQGKPVLFRTRDGGETWEAHAVKTSSGLFDIFFVGNLGWVAGEGGTILRTTDGGETWVKQEVPTSENLTHLFFLSTSQGWAGGEKGTLIRFSN